MSETSEISDKSERSEMFDVHTDFCSILGSRYMFKSATNIALKLALNVALKLAMNTDCNKNY